MLQTNRAWDTEVRHDPAFRSLQTVGVTQTGMEETVHRLRKSVYDVAGEGSSRKASWRREHS